jgi:hypothetical protein
VNGLIKWVKKEEVRMQGTVSMARRALTKTESRLLQRVFKPEPPSKIFGNYLEIGVCLIAMIDNIAEVTIKNICIHNDLANCLKTKLYW